MLQDWSDPMVTGPGLFDCLLKALPKKVFVLDFSIIIQKKLEPWLAMAFKPPLGSNSYVLKYISRDLWWQNPYIVCIQTKVWQRKRISSRKKHTHLLEGLVHIRFFSLIHIFTLDYMERIPGKRYKQGGNH